MQQPLSPLGEVGHSDRQLIVLHGGEHHLLPRHRVQQRQHHLHRPAQQQRQLQQVQPVEAVLQAGRGSMGAGLVKHY